MNLKINIKRPQITKEEIAANKDFGEVLRMYKASVKPVVPFYKKPLFYGAISAAAAVVVFVFNSQFSIFNFQKSASRHTLAYINPPLEKVKITPSVYSVNSDKETTITCKSGTVIKIQPKSFVDKKSGKPVYGKVDLTYSEMNDPIDFFLSGIPMNYDSAGKSYTFESAGMIEIHASQQGRELDLNAEKELAIALASHTSGGPFNLYQLNTEKKRWEYRGQEGQSLADKMKDESAQADSATDCKDGNDADNIGSADPQLAALDSKLELTEFEIKKSEAIVKHIEASRPYEPRQETKGHHRFAVSVSNLNEFPELAIYKDVMFQAGAEVKESDPQAYNTEWESAKLSKRGNNYMLTLHKADSSASYVVHPVFEGEGYNAAQVIYKAKSEQYQESLVERKATEGEKQQELAAMEDVLKDSRKAEVAHIAQKQGESKETAMNGSAANPGNLTFHNFTVHSCGIWNLDNPTMLPQGAMVNARFTDEQGKELQFTMGKVYLVEKGRNVLFSFSGKPDNIGTISYNPEKQNMIWGITDDNKIAVFSYDDFKALGKQTGNYTFKMHVSDVDLADETQVEYYLNI